MEGNTIPFPQALLKSTSGSKGNKRGPQQEEIWEVFKQVKINIPLIDAIKQIPAYAKYMKEMCTQKRHNKVPKKIDLTGQVSAVLSGEIPPKMEDPGTPVISVQVGDFEINRALLDLGASVSILPGSLYDQYDFGPLKKADTTVVLVDLTPKLPRGIVENVIVRVENFYYPVDFLVLDHVSAGSSKQPMVILGRPFLATANAVIDCRTGIVDLAFGNRKLRLNVFSHAPNSPFNSDCFMVDIVEGCPPHENEEVATETCFMCDRNRYDLEWRIKKRKKKKKRMKKKKKKKKGEGEVEIEDFDDHLRQTVNGHRLKPYLEANDINGVDKQSECLFVETVVYDPV
ncbi:hypothetical protein L1987_31388 [Smallanthus sonchifolius]|uniref:Uncharacterized protein n=1 Tax=Smallanthus sonchifolius TaxID=185202 RepID=A0ACB9I5G0_9ASTR|nr:hypothetical protein L1987_31388 [Smallanthus sonchifolius]